MAERTWLIGFPRYTADATYSGGNWQAAYPLANLKQLPFAYAARSASLDLTDTQFKGVLSQSKEVGLLMLCRDNLSLSSKIRVRFYADEAATMLLWDSGWVNRWKTLYDADDPQASWDSGNFWDRTYTEAERTNSPTHRIIYAGRNFVTRSFTVEIDDPANESGYVQFGLCEIAKAVQLPRAPEHGATFGFLSRTVVTEAEGGGKYFERRNKPRIFSGTIPYIQHDTACSLFYELQRQNDLDIPLIWYPDIEDERNELRNSYLARATSLDAIARALIGHSNVAINLEEVL